MPLPKPGRPRAPDPEAPPRSRETGRTKPRTTPLTPLDPIPPQEGLAKAEEPTAEEQDDGPVEPEILVHPPPDAPDVRQECING